ncbi:hypothetical protein J4H92_11290 [Leucobacter weissii]|uniref:Uncharacterized protein n=1 Tax=Leucobacter weissii TaxID=1983706 RepID=A0A939SCK2_9MICO|nr:hypothetical protein [Leucobacter weissii]MBO1902530.1 hypothetical protein [Leucobacter weissii]
MEPEEAATDSYAVLYLGADDDLGQAGADDEYRMTADTDARARAIHEGDLACFDDGAPSPAE